MFHRIDNPPGLIAERQALIAERQAASSSVPVVSAMHRLAA